MPCERDWVGGLRGGRRPLRKEGEESEILQWRNWSPVRTLASGGALYIPSETFTVFLRKGSWVGFFL